ncbi:MAG TPA: matrixin family metalloprotease [Labilithrix sp.]|nr:matrixin family metalloprotease [Labilithrix sp.]
MLRLALARSAAAAFFAFSLLAPRVGRAFCRTTTLPIPADHGPARGCFTEGLPLFWRGACIGYSVNRAASATVPFAEASRVIDEAFAAWNVRCGATSTAVGISTQSLGAVTCSEVRYNATEPNQNLIVFRDESWPHSEPDSTLGLTTVSFNPDTGEIFDVDMEINASGRNLSTAASAPPAAFDLLSIVTHEAGHFLGLAHASDAKSTMFASYPPGTSALRTLEQDDIAGICEIYPSSTERNVAPGARAAGLAVATACDATPRHDFATTCDGRAAPSDAVAGLTGCAVPTRHLPPPDAPPWGPLAMAGGLGAVLCRRRARITTRGPAMHRARTTGRSHGRG